MSWIIGAHLDAQPVVLGSGDLRSAIAAWLSGASFPPSTLLGTADGGHLVGRWTGQALVLGADARPPLGADLDAETLHSLRVFHREAELRVWARGGAIRASQVREKTGDDLDRAVEDQRYLLVGKRRGAPVRIGDVEFSMMVGAAGERHAVPLAGERARLKARHYRHFDVEAGCWRLVGTRWLDLEIS